MLLSIIVFLFAGMALLGGLGLVLWLVQSPSTAPTAQPSFAPTSSVVLQPRNPEPVTPVPPDDLAACRHWFALRSHMEAKGVPSNEIDAYGVGLARNLLLSRKTPEVVTDAS